MNSKLVVLARAKWRRIKPIAMVAIIILTVCLFIAFFARNPEAIHQLKTMNKWSLAIIIGLYAVVTLVLAFVYDLMLKMCRKDLSYKENFLITGYSSIVNFFGPLQSGPGFRIAYLKKKHDVSMRSYFYTVVLYYACFSAVSGTFFIVGFLPLWLCAILFLLGSGFLYMALKIYRKRKGNPRLHFSPGLVVGFIFGVLVQLSLIATIYGVELHSLGHDLTIRQLLTYTGTANFALFVSLTPGALGFREAFLIFTKQLTGLDNAAIVTTNFVDRVMYVTFLALLFGFILLVLGRKKLIALRFQER